MFLQEDKKRSNTAFFGMLVAGALITAASGYASDYLWDKYGPEDSTSTKLKDISDQATGIKDDVAQLSEKIGSIRASIPEDQYSDILDRLKAIDGRAASIVPTVATVASSGRKFINGGAVSDGPHLGNGTFFLPVDGNNATSATICGGYVVTQNPLNFHQASLSFAGKAISARYGETLYLNSVQATVSGSITEGLGRQVFYECDAKA
ncbi:hypothetical protein [Paenirhodobacter populi]|uniref:hypothetical protein n=1 Tax=Paenirhodobacter populi TaxID=2306993 RepID=UPI0019D45DFB|nr:hypothetical protein [Sinirhodobacter populi]